MPSFSPAPSASPIALSGQGIVDRMAHRARHQLPIDPDLAAAALHQHHPDLLQLFPERHRAAGVNRYLNAFSVRRGSVVS